MYLKKIKYIILIKKFDVLHKNLELISKIKQEH